MLVDKLRAAGDVAAFLERVEIEAADFGLVVEPSDNRHRLAYLHGGLPPFPGWFPHGVRGSAPGFWIDFRDRAGRTRATGGGVVYALGPADLASFVNNGGMDADGHQITLDGEARRVAESIGLEVGFSGNLWVPDAADRKTAMSRWLKLTVPLLNKAVLAVEYPTVDAFATFVRDAQIEHLAPSYRLPVLVSGVRWWRRFEGATALHLGVQTRGELLAAIRSTESQPTQPDRRSAA